MLDERLVFIEVHDLDFLLIELDELVDILEDRVRWGLREGVVSNEQLLLIADAAGGDARVLIAILRAAAQAGEQQGMDALSDDLIREATPEAKAEIRRKNLEKLTDHQRTLYHIIEEQGEVAPDALYDMSARG